MRREHPDDDDTAANGRTPSDPGSRQVFRPPLHPDIDASAMRACPRHEIVFTRATRAPTAADPSAKYWRVDP